MACCPKRPFPLMVDISLQSVGRSSEEAQTALKLKGGYLCPSLISHVVA